MLLTSTNHRSKGMAIAVVGSILVVLSLMLVGFWKLGQGNFEEVAVISQHQRVQYGFEEAFELSRSRLRKEIQSVQPTQTLTEIASAYVTNPSTSPTEGAANFFMDHFNGQFSNEDPIYELRSDLSIASDWIPLDTGLRDNATEIRFSYLPLPARFNDTDLVVSFDYEYRIQAQTIDKSASGQGIYLKAEDSGVLSLQLFGAPFSRWSMIRLQVESAGNGGDLHFIGPRGEPGDTNFRLGEIFGGPVHVGDIFADRPPMAGSPVFNDVLTYTSAEGPYINREYTEYEGEPIYHKGHKKIDPIEIPENIFNLRRIAIGKDGSFASIDNTNPVENAELRQELAHYAGSEEPLPAGDQELPKKVYVPYRPDETGYTKRVKGGIYVKGDVNHFIMDVVDRDLIVSQSTDHANFIFNSNAELANCTFQKYEIQQAAETVSIYSTQPGCETSWNWPLKKTFVFSSQNSDELDGNLNGVIYIEGGINDLGGASRTRPAVVKDNNLTLAASSHITITNDLQYEDAEYTQVDESGAPLDEVVATPYGPVEGSGLGPESDSVWPTIDANSKTMLGIVSENGNIHLGEDADVPTNFNLHAMIFAAADDCDAYGSLKGCGFGYKGFDSEGDDGVLKILGGIVEYRNFGVGQFGNTEARGFQKRYVWDSRAAWRNPPGFPRSNIPQITVQVIPMSSWRYLSER